MYISKPDVFSRETATLWLWGLAFSYDVENGLRGSWPEFWSRVKYYS